MKFNRLIVLTGIVIAIAFIAMIMYKIVNTLLPEDSSVNVQAMVIFDDASCVACHRRNNASTLYTTLPVIGQKIKKNRFDIEDSFDRLKKGEAINEVILSKIEQATLIETSMPPAYHYLTHWGATVTPAKQTILKDWLKKHREKFYPNTEAADRFKDEPVRPVPSSHQTFRADNPSLKDEPARPVPASPVVATQKAALGELLFFDSRLSSDNTVSCASCHQPDKGGANNHQYATGVGKRLVNLNTPTVYNTCFDVACSWDGHAANTKDFIREHITNTVIMDNRSLTGDTLSDALAEYTKTLLTPGCRFDAYLKGDETAITQMEISGYELFKSHKCAICHIGVTLGGQSFERMGMYGDYFSDRGWEMTKEDMGRFNYTADEYDRHRFKTPGLRNVALTKPYFHDGSQSSLFEAVQTMGKYQSGKTLSDDDANAIAAFLETLSASLSK